MLMFTGRGIGGKLGDLMRSGLDASPREQIFDETRHDAGASATCRMAALLGRGAGAGHDAGGGAGRAAGAGRLVLQQQGAGAGFLAPESPVAGLARMVSMRSWVELGKALGKFAIVGIAGCAGAVVQPRPAAGPGLRAHPVPPSAMPSRSPGRR